LLGNQQVIFPSWPSAPENPVAVCTRKGAFSPARLAWSSAPVWTVTGNVGFRHRDGNDANRYICKGVHQRRVARHGKPAPPASEVRGRVNCLFTWGACGRSRARDLPRREARSHWVHQERGFRICGTRHSRQRGRRRTNYTQSKTYPPKSESIGEKMFSTYVRWCEH
jgi:hypothetical protein